MRYFGNMRNDDNGQLTIGGCNTLDLVREYDTPLYVMDEGLIRDNCKMFLNSFSMEGIETETIYASKAFLNIAMCNLVKEEGLALDVVSGGELYTALKSNFPPEKIYMHGNNKSREELVMAVNEGVGRIIVDNPYELELLEEICKELEKNIDVLLRVNPGIEAHTHEYIKTTKNDSKFGVSIFSEDTYSLIEKFQNSKFINLKGFHSHIGSQIFMEDSFYEQITVMLEFIRDIKERCGFITKELNLGGGFGIYYSLGDDPIHLEYFLKNKLSLILEKSKGLNLDIPKVMIEPGRSIVANGGTTLYRVGSTKETYGGKSYVFVDGSMNDNPRTALYGAQYEAIVANRAEDEDKENYTITGKCCESGDMIVRDVMLANPQKGDIIAVFSTGAYNYSMASNYNRLPRPPVVFVKDGDSKLVVKRETYSDILRNDVEI